MTTKSLLLSLLKQFSYQQGSFTLASGQQSSFFLDCKKSLLQAQGHVLSAGLMFDEILKLRQHYNISTVAGVPLGGCSLASGVSMYSAMQRGNIIHSPLNALYIRKETKDHGTQQLIEGWAEQRSNVVLLEDVITSGGSSITALDTLYQNGYNPVAVICVIDRVAGGKEAIENKFRIPVISIFTIEDIQ
jgi:orotate phosphoribosyltransferase